MRIFFPAILLVLLVSAGCNIINPPESTPTYVRIDSFAFSGDPAVTGSNSHKITNVYVYFDNAPVGVFDLPASFPVIMDHPGTLSVLPGIDFDGLSGYAAIYPLYYGDTISLSPSPGMEQTVVPNTSYIQGTGLQSNEEFEQGVGSANSFTRLTGTVDLENTSDPAIVFEGHGSGQIVLNTSDSATVIQRNGMSLLTNKNTYIELDYRSNCKIWIGMTVNENSGNFFAQYIVGLNPRSEWGKIYIGADDFIGPHQGTNYKLMIHVERPAGVSDGYAYFDNIKVINFKN